MSIVPTLPISGDAQVESLRRLLRDRDRQITALETRNAELEADLVRERTKSKTVERGAQKLRQQLHPFYQYLQMLFGEMDVMGIGGTGDVTEGITQPASDDPRKAAVWEDWKKKLGGGKVAQAIDVLRLHGELNTKQLRLHLHCDTSYAYQIVSKLYTNGLISKNGGRISLKAL